MSRASTPSDQPSASWSAKRAFLHAFVWIVLLAVAAATAQTIGHVADATRFQDGLVRAGFFVAMLGFASSFLIDTGRTLWGRLIQGLLGVLVAFVALLPLLVNASGGPQPLTDEERQPLVVATVEGETRLEHPTLGFSILHPGPEFARIQGIEAQQLEAHWREYPEMYGSGWQDFRTGRSIFVIYAKGLDSLEAMEGFTSALRESMVGAANVEVLDDRLDPDTLEAHFEGAMVNGLFVEMRAASARLTSDEVPFGIIVFGVSPQRGGLSDVLASLKTP